jgi:hypothetical protein
LPSNKALQQTSTVGRPPAFLWRSGQSRLRRWRYQRHTESHPVQTSYDVRWSTRGSQVVAQHRVPALEQELTVEELDAAIRRVLEAHKINEAAIAVDFAKRQAAPAAELLVAARPFFGD